MQKVKRCILVIPVILVCIFAPFTKAYAAGEETYALDYLNALAVKAGLSTGQLVATIAGVSTVATGMIIANDAGISMGNDAATNLNNLIEAADYPAWADLSTEEQASYGTKTNYDAAKLNSLMKAFGLSDARDSFYSSGGSNFEWQDNWSDRANQLGRIGKVWSDNGYNALSDVIDSVTDKQTLLDYAGQETYKEIEANSLNDWPSIYTNSIFINYGNKVVAKTINTSNNKLFVTVRQSNSDVFWIVIQTSTESNARYAYAFSKNPFSVAASLNQNEEAPVGTYTSANTLQYDGKFYYVSYQSIVGNSSIVQSLNMQTSIGPNNQNVIQNQLIPIILFSDNLNGLGTITTIPEYPADIETESGDTPIYYPGLINANITWPSFTSDGSGNSGEGDSGSGSVQFPEQPWHVIVDNLPSPTWHVIVDNLGNIESKIDAVNDMLLTIKTHMDSNLNQIIITLIQIRDALTVPSNSPEIVGDFDFDGLKTKADLIRENASKLAPFSAFAISGVLLGIWSQSGTLDDPSFNWDFNFFSVHQQVNIDLAYMEGIKPVINFLMLSLLVMCFVRISMHIIEMESAS